MSHKDWVDKAFYAGDSQDGVYFTVENVAGGYAVKALISSTTGFYKETLEIKETFGTYREALTTGLCVALEWCMKSGVWVAADDIDAIKSVLTDKDNLTVPGKSKSSVLLLHANNLET